MAKSSLKVLRNTRKPRIAFATMCKNEESVIGGTLDAIAEYIDYLVFVDTGSTDKTVEIVEEFMERTGIPGEIHNDDWIEFDVNKTKMMQHAFGKADYIIHLDSHMHLQGEIDYDQLSSRLDSYEIEQRRGGSTFSATILWRGDLEWRFVGARHTIMKCDSNPGGDYSSGKLTGCWVQHGAGGMGSRTVTDDNKYGKDALVLEDQFWRVISNDPDGITNRSVFYAGQSWFDQREYQKAINWYTLYTKFRDSWFEEEFEANLRIAISRMRLGQPIELIKYYIDRAIEIEPDRSEPYVIFARHLFYDAGEEKNDVLAYEYMKKAIGCDLENVKSKYVLFIDYNSYGKYIYDDFSVMCYHAGEYEEGIKYLEKIIDEDFMSSQKDRLEKNMEYLREKLG